MVSNPQAGDLVIIRYKKALKSWFPLEGKEGVIRIVCKARKCRNHGVEVAGAIYAIPCGNLFYSKPKSKADPVAVQMVLPILKGHDDG